MSFTSYRSQHRCKIISSLLAALHRASFQQCKRSRGEPQHRKDILDCRRIFVRDVFVNAILICPMLVPHLSHFSQESPPREQVLIVYYDKLATTQGCSQRKLRFKYLVSEAHVKKLSFLLHLLQLV